MVLWDCSCTGKMTPPKELIFQYRQLQKIIYPMEGMQTSKKDRIGAVPSLSLEPTVFYSVSKKKN